MSRALARARARAPPASAHRRRPPSSAAADRRAASSARASTSASASAPTPTAACVLLLGPRDDDLAACARALADVAAAHDVRVVTLSHDDSDGLTRGEQALRLTRGADDDAYALRGSGEDAAIVALDATDGMLARLAYECVLCVVVGGREVCLGEDGHGARARRSAQRCAVAGAPTVCCTIPTTTQTASIEPCARAIEELARVLFRVLPTDAPANNPRSHFPFPTNGRWALGSAQVRLDAALAAQVLDDSGDEFATKDCWSLGGLGTMHVDDTTAVDAPTPASRRAALRDAFREADVYLNVSVPATWTPRSRFRATRPGVFWRQQRVHAVFTDDDDVRASPDAPDPFGRTLPARAVASDARASARGARFVRQLATERVITARARASSASASPSPPTTAPSLPTAFRVSKGVVVADDAPRGDLDAVARGFAAVAVVPTWPFAHAFALTDAAFVESFREDVRTGLPLFLCQP